MDDPPGVGVGQRLANLLKDLEEARQVVRRRFAFLEEGGQRSPFHQLHGEVGTAVGETAGLVDGDDAGVLQLAADLRLLHEAAHRDRVVAVPFEEDLDGEVAAEFEVAPLEDCPHAAVAQLAEDPVAGDFHQGRRGRQGGPRRLGFRQRPAFIGGGRRGGRRRINGVERTFVWRRGHGAPRQSRGKVDSELSHPPRPTSSNVQQDEAPLRRSTSATAPGRRPTRRSRLLSACSLAIRPEKANEPQAVVPVQLMPGDAAAGGPLLQCAGGMGRSVSLFPLVIGRDAQSPSPVGGG